MVDFVGLVDGVDGLLDVPEAGGGCQCEGLFWYGGWGFGYRAFGDLLVDGCVLSETAEFALDGDAAWVVGSGLDGVEGRSALGVGVVVVVVEVAGAVVEPAAGGDY